MTGDGRGVEERGRAESEAHSQHEPSSAGGDHEGDHRGVSGAGGGREVSGADSAAANEKLKVSLKVRKPRGSFFYLPSWPNLLRDDRANEGT